jgi:predicted PurR-regulated permease PerM
MKTGIEQANKVKIINRIETRIEQAQQCIKNILSWFCILSIHCWLVLFLSRFCILSIHCWLVLFLSRFCILSIHCCACSIPVLFLYIIYTLLTGIEQVQQCIDNIQNQDKNRTSQQCIDNIQNQDRNRTSTTMYR